MSPLTRILELIAPSTFGEALCINVILWGFIALAVERALS